MQTLVVLTHIKNDADSLARALSGFSSVVRAKSVNQVVQLCSQSRVDGILVEAFLEHEDVFDLLKKLSAVTDPKIICYRINNSPIAKNLDSTIAFSCRKLGASAYLVLENKNEQEIADAVREVLCEQVAPCESDSIAANM